MPDHGKVKKVRFAEYARYRQELREEIAAVNWLLVHLGKVLPATSPTAMAIARRATWREILQLARWEDAEEIVALLEEAEQTFGLRLPADTRIE
jgi:hypothetical protein